METSPTELGALLLNEPEEGAAEETHAPESEHQPAHENEPSAEEPEASENPDPEPEGEEAQETEQPLTLKELAAQLEMEPKELYDIELGEGLTIGQLKDRFKDLTAAEGILAKAELQKTETENDLLQKRRELELFQANIGREPTEAEQHQIRQQLTAYVERENAAIMQAIPEWQDPAIAEVERREIGALLKAYGMSDPEIAQVTERRQVKLLNDFNRLRKIVAGSASEEVRPTRKQKPRSRRRTSASNADRAVQGFKDGKVKQNDAIAALIADGIKS